MRGLPSSSCRRVGGTFVWLVTVLVLLCALDGATASPTQVVSTSPETEGEEVEGGVEISGEWEEGGGEEVAVDMMENAPVAFAMVTAAGLSTTVGAALVFCKGGVTPNNKKVLGGSLGFSAGVMIYVSFVEIFQKSVSEFEACGCLGEGEEDVVKGRAYASATACFFSGVLLTLLLGKCVRCITTTGGDEGDTAHIQHHGHGHGPSSLERAVPRRPPHAPHADDASADAIAANSQEKSPLVNMHVEEAPLPPSATDAAPDAPDTYEEEQEEVRRGSCFSAQLSAQLTDIVISDERRLRAESMDERARLEQKEKRKLQNMGVMTALAIGLHNLPEGLATLVAALDDPAVGVSLAVAIAIHNIPEGLCVSVPIYYATGSRWKGFWLAFWSGVAEIVGAVLGYALLSVFMGSAATFAVLFGIVSGMMVSIVAKEVLPTAHQYDPEDKIVTACLFVGMGFMALSLVLFVV